MTLKTIVANQNLSQKGIFLGGWGMGGDLLHLLDKKLHHVGHICNLDKKMFGQFGLLQKSQNSSLDQKVFNTLSFWWYYREQESATFTQTQHGSDDHHFDMFLYSNV